MADWVQNIAKGRHAAYFHRVKNNDPANSAIILVPLSAIGTEAQGQDYDDLAALLGDANFDEQTSGGWSRKTLTDAELPSQGPDDTNNRGPSALPQATWTTPTAGNDVDGLAVCYDPDTTTGTDSSIIVLSVHGSFAVTADGLDQILNAGDCFRAS